MRRREFITIVGGAACIWPLAARAQPTSPVIGFLSSRSPDESADIVEAFRGGLKENGFIEGQNAVGLLRAIFDWRNIGPNLWGVGGWGLRLGPVALGDENRLRPNTLSAA
jgi:hypothetical protein